jgi:dTDP-4-dehydrorhamnose reductase
MDYPAYFESVEALEEYLSRPSPKVVESMHRLEGDILILGVGGKMGPTLAMLARRAVVEAGVNKRVIGVSRFSDPQVAEKLDRAGVETISCDLMDDEAPNVVYMVGSKFGTIGQEARTWAVNAFLPGRVVDHFRHSRIVLFSSGNVYPLTPVIEGGCTEDTPPAPVGEYAQSVLGRERIVQYFCAQLNVPGVLFRLNYAVEMRYGVLIDIARKVWAGETIDLHMGHVNVIWQGDANAYALRALALAEMPPKSLNVTGPETASVRSLAVQFGKLLDRTPIFEGREQPDALLSNAGQACALMGYPRVPLRKIVEWTAAWVMAGGALLGKPTKFQVRDGKF